MSPHAEHLEGAGRQTKGLQEVKTKMASECIVLYLNEFRRKLSMCKHLKQEMTFIFVFAFAAVYNSCSAC